MPRFKYPLYAIFSIFILLMFYSLSTEKPRQYRAKPIPEISLPGNIPEIFTKEEEKSVISDSSKNEGTAKNPVTKTQNKTSESIQSATNVVLAFSNNDAGGKIVLTHTKCEKSTTYVAYTTAQDGKIDYGCWTYDELYIFINWDKDGLNNYTFDRFFDMATGQRLKSKHLFESTKDSSVKISSPANNSSTPVTTNLSGGKK